jgi:hypothetical protein
MNVIKRALRDGNGDREDYGVVHSVQESPLQINSENGEYGRVNLSAVLILSTLCAL